MLQEPPDWQMVRARIATFPPARHIGFAKTSQWISFQKIGPLPRRLPSTASPASSLALIEIAEALSASLWTLARVFGRAPRVAGPITFVPFTCVGGSDRSERHCWNRQRCNCNGEHTTSVHMNIPRHNRDTFDAGVGRAELRRFGARPPAMVHASSKRRLARRLRL